MKILVITGSYPPHHSGGYELRSKDILDRLRQRGNDIVILTTKCPDGKCYLHPDEKNVFRILHQEPGPENLFKKILFEYQDIDLLHKNICGHKPDLLYLFHVINLTRTIFPYLAENHIPVVFDEGGKGYLYSFSHRGTWYSFVCHKSKSWLKNCVKYILVKCISLLSHDLLKQRWAWPSDIQVYFNSYLNRNNAIQAGVNAISFPVIHSGIDERQFSYRPREEIGMPIRILVPGRIEPRKGQLDSVSLLASLLKKNIDARVTIIGKCNSASYLQIILEKIRVLGIEDKVIILPMMGHGDLVSLYHSSDICFFPSYAKTGFSRIPLEAMACGSLVFSYGNEGSDEILMNSENGFIVPDGNTHAIVEIICHLSQEKIQYQKMIRNARKYIEELHTMDLYIDQIDSVLNKAVYGKFG
jgi:glycosyltransferase involved in cell wall biosynthesis